MHKAIEEAAALTDAGRADEAITLLETYLAGVPDDPLALYELGSAQDSAGREALAIEPYRRALLIGLPPDYALAARIQLGSTLRNVGATRDAVSLLEAVVAERLDHRAARMFLALALTSDGRAIEAVRQLLDLLLTHPGPPEAYARSLRAYTDELEVTPSDGLGRR